MVRISNKQDKILNPNTGRYVLKTGKIGKELLKQNISPKRKKQCSDDKIFNPDTGRCVLKNGKIGRKLSLQKDSGKIGRKLSLQKDNYKKDKKNKKDCSIDKILNPDTGRCVLKT